MGMADNILGEDYSLEMASFTPATREELTYLLQEMKLDKLVNIKNPLDLTPMATEILYEATLRVFLEDPGIDMVVIGITPFTPMIQGLSEEAEKFLSSEQGIIGRLAGLSSQFAKPLIVVVDSGSLFDYLANMFQEAGLPVFRSADRAMRVLGKYIQGRLKSQ